MISQRAKNAGLKELDIFDHFEIDKNLPKYHSENGGAKVQESQYGDIPTGNNWLSVGGTTASTVGITPQVWIAPSNDNPRDSNIVFEKGHYIYKAPKKSLRKFLLKLLDNEKKETTKLISIVDFFANVTKSCEEITIVEEIAKYYENAMKQAITMGQTALLQKLKDNLDVVKGEAVLVAAGLKKCVTQKQVIEYYEKVGEDKNLKLTWIKNFGRVIPEKIYRIKKEIDERKIFDNYVVLHYDPKDDGSKLTKEEIEKKKDPILFGVIKNNDKLYYVADWKDDYCDLTLDEMFKVLKEKVLEINNKSVKTYISKIKA
jgi:hypothetical protein